MLTVGITKVQNRLIPHLQDFLHTQEYVKKVGKKGLVLYQLMRFDVTPCNVTFRVSIGLLQMCIVINLLSSSSTLIAAKVRLGVHCTNSIA